MSECKGMNAEESMRQVRKLSEALEGEWKSRAEKAESEKGEVIENLNRATSRAEEAEDRAEKAEAENAKLQAQSKEWEDAYMEAMKRGDKWKAHVQELESDNLRYESEIAEVCEEDYSLKESWQRMTKEIDHQLSRRIAAENEIEHLREHIATLEARVQELETKLNAKS